jgi:hypothetical protein
MKNENLFPLVRNNYFFGKLMTEREYAGEQTYFNNKRRLLNAVLVGSGVVCGLTVTKADGATVAVESGLALDGLGRELTVPQLIVTRLSDLDGFSGDRGYMPHVYLCAEYAETPIEPIHAMGGGTGTARFSCVSENTRLYLRYGEPEEFEITRSGAEDYRAENLEKKLERGARERLYLAKIFLVRWEDAYEIDSIEQTPFGQYASVRAIPETRAQPEPDAAEQREYFLNAEETKTPPSVTLGAAEVKIPKGAKPGSLHFSADISHGLGLVPAALTLGLASDGGAVFGNAAIFNGNQEFDYAAKINAGEGTFRIGVRVNTRMTAKILNFVWSAVCDPAGAGADAPETPRVVVTPAAARLKPLETLRLTAECRGLPDTDVVWSVREPLGGDVTRDGAYTAPADPGVYTVVAKCGDTVGTALIAVN